MAVLCRAGPCRMLPGMEVDGTDDPTPRHRDRADVEWVRPGAPVAVAAVGAAVVLAALGLWVVTGELPGPVADVLLVVGVLLVLRDRGLLSAPDRTADAAVVVGSFAWCVALACGLVVSVQRAVWVDSSPVSWWVHVLPRLDHATVWRGLLGGVAAAVIAGLVVTALLRVRLVRRPRTPPGHPG